MVVTLIILLVTVIITLSMIIMLTLIILMLIMVITLRTIKLVMTIMLIIIIILILIMIIIVIIILLKILLMIMIELLRAALPSPTKYGSAPPGPPLRRMVPRRLAHSPNPRQTGFPGREMESVQGAFPCFTCANALRIYVGTHFFSREPIKSGWVPVCRYNIIYTCPRAAPPPTPPPPALSEIPSASASLCSQLACQPEARGSIS